jgi:hypothetical protein
MLQGSTRFIFSTVGPGGCETFPASAVASNSYGVKVTTLKACNAAAGRPATITLIGVGSSSRLLRVDFPVHQFNHAILCVPMAKTGRPKHPLADTPAEPSVWLHRQLPRINRHALLLTGAGGW